MQNSRRLDGSSPCAHPDDESFGLGGIISAYVAAGAEVNLVCLTRGEASMLGADRSELAEARNPRAPRRCPSNRHRERRDRRSP